MWNIPISVPQNVRLYKDALPQVHFPFLFIPEGMNLSFSSDSFGRIGKSNGDGFLPRAEQKNLWLCAKRLLLLMQERQLTGEEAHKLERVGGEILALVK